MNKIILTVTLIILVVLGFAFVELKQEVRDIQVESAVLAGADDVGTYTHLSSTNASSTAGTVVRGGAGVLNTLTINTTSAQIVKIYDGDSSATSSATLIASIKASAAEQTFFYNVAVKKGIVVETPASYVGSITLSHR